MLDKQASINYPTAEFVALIHSIKFRESASASFLAHLCLSHRVGVTNFLMFEKLGQKSAVFGWHLDQKK